MKYYILYTSVLILCIFAACNAPIELRDIKPEQLNLNSSFDKNVMWTFEPGGEQVATTPSYHDGFLFFGASQSWVYVLDPSTGEKIDRMWADVPIVNPPTLQDSLITFSGHSEWNFLKVANIYNGQYIWEKSAFPPGANVILDDTLLFYITRNGGLSKLNLDNGRFLSHYKLNGAVSSNVLDLDSMLVLSTRNNFIYFIDKKNITINKSFKLDESPIGGELVNTGNYIYGISENNWLYKLDINSGNIIKKQLPGRTYSNSPVIYNESAITLSEDGIISSMNLYTLENDWINTLENTYFSQPVICEWGLLCITYRGEFQFVDLTTGKIVDTFSIHDKFVTKPLVIENRLIIAPSTEGFIYAIE